MNEEKIVKSLTDLKEETVGINRRLSALIAIIARQGDSSGVSGDFKLDVFLSNSGIGTSEVAKITGKTENAVYVAKSLAKSSKKAKQTKGDKTTKNK